MTHGDRPLRYGDHKIRWTNWATLAGQSAAIFPRKRRVACEATACPPSFFPTLAMDASRTPSSRRSSRRLRGIPAVSQPIPTVVPGGGVQSDASATDAGAATVALPVGAPPPPRS